MNTGSRVTSSITPATRHQVGEGRRQHLPYTRRTGWRWRPRQQEQVFCKENKILCYRLCVKHCLRNTAGRRAWRREVPAVAPWRGSGLRRGNKRPRQEARGA